MLRLLVPALVLIATTAFAEELKVDHRFKPATWNTAINLPDDWQKTLVSQTGAVLYDYPGPFSKFKTAVTAGFANADAVVLSQRLLDARTPIVQTTSEANGVRIKQEAFAIVDSPFKKIALAKTRLYRVGRDTADLEWAHPPAGVDPAFQHVAKGQNQPIRHVYEVEVGGARTIALGLIEAYWKVAGKRPQEIRVEGSKPQIIDTIAVAGFNRPFVAEYSGRDVNGDGRIEIEVRPVSTAPEKTTVLSAIWVFDKGFPNGNLVAAGKLNTVAEAFISCGEDPNRYAFATRRDVLHVEYEGSNFTPALKIQTTRAVALNKQTGVVSFNGRPFMLSQPAPVDLRQNANGESSLVYENGTRVIDVVFVRGPEVSDASMRPINFTRERARAIAYWQKLDIPWNRIQVPDQGIQQLLDSSVRNIYQAREIKNGKAEFRVGPTIYRDLWLVDGSFLLETAVQLGVVDEARRAIDRILELQQPNGQVIILQPDFYKETGITLWMLQRHARLTQDKAWLQARWKNVEQGVKWIKDIRKVASRDPNALYAGLIPPGHSDGGIEGSNAEYTNVYWNLTGLKAAVEAAEWLGKANQAAEWQREYNDFFATFQRAANRDMRTDAQGNKYLPILMNPGPNDLPQKAQWAFCQAIFPGKILAANDPIATGTLAMLDAQNSEGLVLSTGWMTGGIWTYFGSFYGHAHLWMGGQNHIAKAQNILYAFANHASPLLVWREEQQPVGQGTKMVGDMPHNWASAEFIRLVRHMIALERDDNLILFEGIPSSWLKAGKELRMDDIATEFGRLSLRATVSSNGNAASIRVSAVGSPDQSGAPIIDLRAFKQLGFKSETGQALPDQVVGKWGQTLRLNLAK